MNLYNVPKNMALSAGMKLGPYEVISALGAGGMGEVYRAADTRLGRHVAIKILPASFAQDAVRLRRFEYEAKAVAALNHPNILAIHDIGEDGGVPYMVSELLDGHSLRVDLSHAKLSTRKAVDYAVQMAQGLAAAHDKNVIHRDLKPENVFVTRQGRIKILDFGLAKLATTGPRSDSNSAAITLTEAPTEAGTVLGTVGYMAPEQVRGSAVDARTDIFAFGTVLYEMVSGQRAFHRDTAAETMTAILKEEPPEFSAIPNPVSPALERIVRRCIEKDPEQRFQSSKDLSFALENISGVSSSTQMQASPSPLKRWDIWRTAALILAVALLIAVGLDLSSLLVKRPQPEFKQITFRSGYVGAARFAPGGHTIVYNAAWDHPAVRLYSSREDGTEVRDLDLSGTVESISSSGELATILSSGKLARVPLNGGAPRELLENVVAADWSPDGTQLAVSRFESGKCRLDYPIGKPLYESVGVITDLRVAPGGDALAFMEHPLDDDRGKVVLLEIKSNKRTVTREWTGERGLAWSSDGSEVMFTATRGTENERDLYAISRTGKQRLIFRAPGGVWLEDIAPDGRVLLKHQERRFEVTIGKIGGESKPLSSLQMMTLGSVSRDGGYAVMTDMSGNGGTDYRVYFAKLDGSPAVLLGSGVASGISPDNKWVASVLPSDPSKILLLPTGVGDFQTVTARNFVYGPALWTADGKRLVVRASQSGQPMRFWVQEIDSISPRPVTPEGVASGRVVTIRHTDYVAGRDATGETKLYPVDGGSPKPISGIRPSDILVGASPDSDDVYILSDLDDMPQQILKLNMLTGLRQPFASISPTDPAGILSLGVPTITADQQRYIGTQLRAVSVLYIATGLK